jgi:hypothetical protein
MSDAATNNEITTFLDKGNKLYWPAVNEFDQKITDLSTYFQGLGSRKHGGPPYAPPY